ncbi:MAG TPA: class I SAM-dependent methyltransferase [Longimicrobium sp.]
MITDPDACKLCGSRDLRRHAHTAGCRACGALLYFPYPAQDQLPHLDVTRGKAWTDWNEWYYAAASRNHSNFTQMLRFATEGWPADFRGDVLDYGGGGGQFALVVASHFPNVTTWITDIDQAALLEQWRPYNHVLPFDAFPRDSTRFDAIFLNDVYEHVDSPQEVLRVLAPKLKPRGLIFIDTPRTFWLYPLLRTASPALYTRLCRGTVTRSHLQLWTRRAFDTVAEECGLRVERYRECSEFTMPAEYYLNNMGITSRWVRLVGRMFHAYAGVLARNKIMAVLRPARAVHPPRGEAAQDVRAAEEAEGGETRGTPGASTPPLPPDVVRPAEARTLSGAERQS